MKNFKKLMALAIAVVMMLAMAIPAMAAEGDYKITVANNNDSVSIDDQVYSAYKLFDLSYNTDKTAYSYTISTSNYFYTTAKAVLDNYFTFKASAADSTVMVVEPKTTGTYYDATTKTLTEAGVRQLADDLQEYLADAAPVMTGTADGESAEINVGQDGYYIITGSATPTDPKSNETVVSAVILTNAQPTATVAPKVSIPTLDKKITGVTEDGSKLDEAGKAAVAKVGAKVSYELDSITPDLRGYTDYTFIIGDAISNGLTYDKSSFVLNIDGSEVDIDPVFATGDKSFTLTIPFDTLDDYAAGKAVVLTYDCTVNSGALTTDYENNTANLEYSHSPYDDTTNKTPDKETYVIDLNIDVDKVADSASGSKLSGAIFKLYKSVAGATTYAAADAYDANATYYSDAEGTTPVEIADADAFTAYDGTLYVASTGDASRLYYKWADNKVTWVDTQAAGDDFETNAQGKLTTQVRGLDQGTYYLEETVAPEGYNPLDQPVEVTIAATHTTSGTTDQVTYTSASGATITNGTVDLTAAQNSNQPVATATIINKAGTVLPSTGGIGTTIFYIIGGCIVLAAVIFLIIRSKKSSAK